MAKKIAKKKVVVKSSQSKKAAKDTSKATFSPKGMFLHTGIPGRFDNIKSVPKKAKKLKTYSERHPKEG